MKSPVELLSTLLQGCKRLEPCVKGIDRDVITIENRVKNEGYGFLTVALPAFCNAFDEGLSVGKFTCPPGFKKTRGGEIPRLFSGILCEVFDLVSGTILDEPNLGIVKSMREILRLFKKLDLPSHRAERLDAEAKAKFFNVDDDSASIKLDDRHRRIVEAITENVLTELDLFHPSDLRLKHGPGAVAESVTTNQKWSVVYDHLDHIRLSLSWGLNALSDGWPLSDRRRPLSDSAKLVTVPKDSTSRRTITIEPCLKQFIQQGLNTYLRDSIKKDPVLRSCLALTDQSMNQILALEGSLTDKWATIDLSSASDLMSLDIVKLVFGRQTSFLEVLLDCRSEAVRNGETVRTISKFAGMGNATTFPVQSVVFAVIAIAAVHDDRHEWPTPGSIARIAKRIRVYGDDIIVPTEHALAVVRWLAAAGLKVNLRKSFLRGYFKESCGVDAYKGVDVTPLYLRHLPSSLSKKTPNLIQHFVQLSNHAWLRGLYEFAAALVECAEEALGSPLPLVTSTSGLLGLHTRQDCALVQRWSKTLHRFELRAYVLLPVFRKDGIDGYEALLKFFLTSREENEGGMEYPNKFSDPEHLRRSPVRFKSRIASRWVPV